MRLLSAAALALTIGAAHSFRDTSPFFMFSTSAASNLHNVGDKTVSQLRTASSLTSDISSFLSKCPSDLYIIVSQPGVQLSSYASGNTVPALSTWMSKGKEQGILSRSTTDEVVGDINVENWFDILEKDCGAKIVDVDTITTLQEQTTWPLVLNVRLPAPSTTEDLSKNDAFFASIMEHAVITSYTVLYVTSPGQMNRRMEVAETGVYEMEVQAQEAMHIDLRRDLSGGSMKRANNETLVDGPLFDRYQFFTPGLFMGFVVGFLLLTIAYVGVSALASLQVSYAAFDKESGQFVSKKAQ